VPARRHLGAANATGLEWGVRPAFLDRLIATQCRGGLLRHTMPDSEAFKEVGDWADRERPASTTCSTPILRPTFRRV
jgi:hypothetical protein